MDPKNRFWEIDLTRGIAIIAMVAYHLSYDLNYFNVYGVDINSGFWWYLARSTAVTFLLLVGVSLTLSYSKTKIQTPEKNTYRKYLKRGFDIFMLGLAITATTWLLLEEGTILFGILPLIGVSIILAYPFLQYRYLNFIAGVIIISIGIHLKSVTINSPYLFWMGLRPEYFYTLDYFPILPWFGVILIGLFLGNLLYYNSTRMFNLWNQPKNPIVTLFCLIGRHSLPIYLAHQPVLITTLHVFGIIEFITQLP
ncbi:hypothetical protein B6U67_01935 [Methanosarcinales archaeon ex4484_138]|nr:MAG: hypothetical protein B6U67_01935 [Methanosarcinales archaeon ex4484_138]RLG26628.1 MAG: DUF1624 domain-containing protein [Methanosarcinales archaeon]